MTPHERRERRIDIEGEIKQVLALITECEADETDKTRILASAKAATAKQRGRLADLMDEVDRLAADTHADWQSLKELGQPGLPVTSDQDGTEPSDGDPPLITISHHGHVGAFAAVEEAKLNAIFHEATNP